jgi:hypothetical protein
MNKGKITKKKIDGDQFINKDTGELLSSEVPGVSSVSSIDRELMVMHSEEYVIIDSKALMYIQENFNPVDLGRILKMADMTYGEYNILYNNGVPHNKETLMEELNYSRNKFANFLKRLEMKSVIYYIVGYVDGRKVKHIMLNPHLARKRKTIHRNCLVSFQPLTKKLL